MPAHAIQFQPPVGWVPLPEEEVTAARSSLPPLDARVQVQPRHLFVDPEGGSLLSVSTLTFEGAPTPAEQVALYWQMLTETGQAQSLEKAAFLKDGLRVTQLHEQRDGRVRFTLLLETPANTVLRFDYVIPRERYAEELRSLESSIGSIEPIVDSTLTKTDR